MPLTRSEKQEAFLCLDNCLEVLFGGAAGPGKSWALLMGALQWVDVPGYAALLVRRTSPELTASGGLIDIANEWLAGTDARWNGSKKRWTFPTGGKPAVLEFQHYEEGIRGQQKKYGGQYQYIGVDEASEFTEREIRFLYRSLRRPEGMDVPLRMRLASNPIGVGAPFLKERFLVGGNRIVTETINGETVTYERRYVPAKLDDNPFMDRSTYIRSLGMMEPHLMEALLNGDWDVKPPGRMFRREDFRRVPGAPAECWWVRFWDLAGTDEGKAGPNTSWTVGVKMGTDGSGIYYIGDVRRARLEPSGVKNLIRQTAMMDDGPDVTILIEQEGGSSGKAVIDDYVTSLPLFRVEGRHPSGPKMARAVPFANQVGAGKVRLVEGAWNGAYLDEMEQVPSRMMDCSDASAGAFTELASGLLASERLIEGFGEYERPDW